MCEAVRKRLDKDRGGTGSRLIPQSMGMECYCPHKAPILHAFVHLCKGGGGGGTVRLGCPVGKRNMSVDAVLSAPVGVLDHDRLASSEPLKMVDTPSLRLE